MKVRALRVAEVGPFADGVTLEGLSGKLDVLTGPNEFGKSTLFKALVTLIGEKHSSVAKSVQELRPNRGGAPQIEADIEIGGQLWRLRKRFLAQKSAVLLNLDSGGTWRGVEAEDKIRDLIGGPNREPMRSLLWVAQGAGFTLPEKTDTGLSGSLAELIEQEVAESTGARQLRRIRQRVEELRGALVTASHGRPRAGGALALALADRRRLQEHLQEAQTRAGAAAERVTRLATLRAEHSKHFAPAAAAQLEQHAHTARATLKRADQAIERERTAEQRVAACALKHKQSKAAIDDFERGLSKLEALTAERQRLTLLQRQCIETRAAHEAQLKALSTERDRVAAALSETQRLLRLERALAEAVQARRDAEAMTRRLDQARTTAVEIAEHEARLAAQPAREPMVREARRLAGDLATTEAQLAAAAPQIRLDADAASSGRIHIGGQPVTDQTVVIVDKELDIAIDGIGKIVISPGHVGLEGLKAQRDELQKALHATLTHLRVDSVERAEAAFVARLETERALAEAEARFTSLAPAGLTPLQDQLQAVLARAGDAPEPPQPLPDRAELELQERSMAREAEALDASCRGLDDENGSNLQQLTRLEAELASIDRQLQSLHEQLPAPAEREQIRADLAAADQHAASALSEAVRDRAAWADAAPKGIDHEALVRAKDAAEREVRSFAERREQLARAIAEIEGALQRDRAEGTGSEVDELSEQLVAAEHKVADLEEEVQALTLLAEHLVEIGEAHRTQVMAPVIDRLEVRLRGLLVDAKLAFDGPLRMAGLERDGQTDLYAQLSAGTREQIATVVRLTYAEMMAARGTELPVVLDDALVFTDERRLAVMAQLLSEAARHHQVIVLTCRQSMMDTALAPVSAHRLDLKPWLVEQQATEPRRRAHGASLIDA